MSHRPRGRDLFNFKCDCVRFVSSHPNRQHRLAVDILKYDDWRAAVWIHHQCPDLNFYFHKKTSLSRSRHIKKLAIKTVGVRGSGLLPCDLAQRDRCAGKIDYLMTG